MFAPICRLLRGGESGYLAPGREASLQQGVLLRGGEEMTAGAEVVGDGAERTQELLGVLGGFEALKHAFSSSGGAVRVLRTVV